MADEQVREGAAALARRRLAQSRARQRVYLATAAGPVEAFRAAVPHFPVGKS